jgi:RNA polymerase sigma factor (sigma-70 family)
VSVATTVRAGGATEAPSLASAAERHLDDVYRYVLYLIGDPNVAEDLTAETFELAARKWKRFDPRRGSERTWLCQLARSRTLDHLRAESRRRKREERFASDHPEAVEQVFGEGLSPELDAGLRRLSAGEREVVVLRVVLDLDTDETARLLGISPSACTTRLSRALKRLEEELT